MFTTLRCYLTYFYVDPPRPPSPDGSLARATPRSIIPTPAPQMRAHPPPSGGPRLPSGRSCRCNSVPFSEPPALHLNSRLLACPVDKSYLFAAEWVHLVRHFDK